MICASHGRQPHDAMEGTMNALRFRFVAVATACAALMSARDVRAFRMIQNMNPGRTSSGSRVTCDDPGGFTHWTKAAVEFRLNTANQGGAPGVPAALQSSLAAWTSVTPASYQL